MPGSARKYKDSLSDNDGRSANFASENSGGVHDSDTQWGKAGKKSHLLMNHGSQMGNGDSSLAMRKTVHKSSNYHDAIDGVIDRRRKYLGANSNKQDEILEDSQTKCSLIGWRSSRL